MAWRIHDSVLRGEVDNRQPGIVTGRIWLHGMTEPIALDLKGNASSDLAGCLLTFENEGKTFPLRKDATLAPVQQGSIGDLTASRKVRVYDVPFEEAYERLKKKLPVPEHLANCLYLEWFSEANGRVVIESTEFKLTISPPAWRLTPEQERERSEQAARGFAGFLQKLTEALEAQRHRPPEDKDWDEFDYEQLLRESDARTDKYGELLDKYRDHPERERIIAREMGWSEPGDEPETEIEGGAPPEAIAGDEEELGQPEPEDEEPVDYSQAAEEAELDPATEGVDWVRDESGYPHHPLCDRVSRGTVALMRKLKELGLEAQGDEGDMADLVFEYQMTGAKLAGALNSLGYGRDIIDGPFIVACLKRGLGHLHAAQAALEKVSSASQFPVETVAMLRTEFFEVREEILRLMEEFRGKRRE
jgi:hypothetical protein